MNEIRKDVPISNGYYQASNLGRLKHKDRILKQRLRKGYLICAGKLNGVGTTLTVHRLVAMAFIDNLENKRTVNHKDGNRLNNNVENLERMTDSENCKHRFTHLGHKSTFNGKKGYEHNCSLEVAKLDDNKNILEKFGSIAEAGRYMGVSSQSIKVAIKKPRRRCKGFFWKFTGENYNTRKISLNK